LTISRLDLDGVGSPGAIAARIHEIESDLPLAVPIAELCGKLDIATIGKVNTTSFEAALVMDVNKAIGGILLAAGRSRKRHRYSLGHELGHFLIPTHIPLPGQRFECSLDDLHLLDTQEQNRRKRIEAEANRFAAALLMPPARIRANYKAREPDLAEIIRLADEFDVSKEAMARAYVDAQRGAVAVVMLEHDRIRRIYRKPEHCPWLTPGPGQAVPADSIASGHRMVPGQLSDIEECEPDVWFDEFQTSHVDILTEQLLVQRSGFAMILLHAELIEDDNYEADRTRWSAR
jgi:Zn-dependent peptidase ImmA (M78 family)